MTDIDLDRIADAIADRVSHRLKHMSTPAPKYYSRAEAAKMLGVSPSTLDRRVADGTIQAKRINRRVVFSSDSL